MKASFYTESVLYQLARGISFLAQRLPPQVCAGLGKRIGSGLYHLLRSRRPVALSNLRAAFGDTYTPQQYAQILKEMFQNFGMTFLEMTRLPTIDLAYLDQWVQVAPGSEERLQAALAQGRGVIFLTGHFGNWELISTMGSLRGYPSLVLAREQGWPKLNRMLTEYRESTGCKVITKGFPIRELIRGLREGKIVGILADQDGGRHGVLAPFFGRLASTASGTIALSLNTEAPILPVFITRVSGFLHRLEIGDPLHVPAQGSLEERVRGGVSNYLVNLERQVRENPSQWLWLHRRWKSSPQRRLLIFSDGKAGHLSQMRGLVEKIETAWSARAQQDKRLAGLRDQILVETQTVEVAFRHPIWRVILGVVASLVPKRFCGSDRWLRWGLAPATYETIRSAHADFSISCGASTAAVSLLWSKGIRARAIHVTQSRLPSWRKFDLAVLPRHDQGARGSAPNLLVTDGALTPAPKLEAEQKNQMLQALGCQAPKQIGLFLGGPAKGVTLTAHQVDLVIRSLLEACETLDAELLVSTSRRTPAPLEEKLAETLQNHPRCRLLTLVNRNDPGKLGTTAEAVECILGLSQAVAVSGDSISMVSEALARSKPVVGFFPTKVGLSWRSPKYHRFLHQLESRQRLVTAPVEKVGQAVADLIEGSNGDPATSRGPKLLSADEDPVVEFLKTWL